MDDPAHAILRANPGYELVLLDRMATGVRETIDGDGELYGVLHPRPDTDLELRTASSDTALLFLTLREPGPLPSYAHGQLGGQADRAISRLVLDGVLEIEHGGEFVSGARASELVLAGRSTGGRGRIGVLSSAAVRYGQELAKGGLTEAPLASRLYCYGRRPVTPALARRLGAADAFAAHLGIDAGGPARASLDAGWVQASATLGERAYWRSWRARRARDGSGRWDAGYKLYVSPGVEALGVAFAAVAGLLSGAPGAKAFKVGADADGLCRPDKLVVYFDRLEDLQQGASRLREEIDGAPAHGVPFTAAVTSDGLLSWGADPPALAGLNTSWRSWVAERLAEYLLLGGSAELEPWQLALERLRLAGIDTDTWIPQSGMWEQTLASA